jgi:hypothetical protein
MSKIEATKKPEPITLMIPGDKVRGFINMLDLARITFNREWEEDCKGQSDPAKRAVGIKHALDTVIEVLEAVTHAGQ